ncbi:MAG: hypothetical protein IT374_03055 [Polyangiaceae bacterium]|nr:hypothetical protein [Polyangiaceae bacterium]
MLAASTPGFKPWTKTFDVKVNGDVQEHLGNAGSYGAHSLPQCRADAPPYLSTHAATRSRRRADGAIMMPESVIAMRRNRRSRRGGTRTGRRVAAESPRAFDAPASLDAARATLAALALTSPRRIPRGAPDKSSDSSTCRVFIQAR